LFLDLLRRGFSEEEMRRQFDMAIQWGRNEEFFDFDASAGQLTLEPAHPPPDQR
jgi:NitT/TauT family transport system ATP-binding protein